MPACTLPFRLQPRPYPPPSVASTAASSCGSRAAGSTTAPQSCALSKTKNHTPATTQPPCLPGCFLVNKAMLAIYRLHNPHPFAAGALPLSPRRRPKTHTRSPCAAPRSARPGPGPALCDERTPPSKTQHTSPKAPHQKVLVPSAHSPSPTLVALRPSPPPAHHACARAACVRAPLPFPNALRRCPTRCCAAPGPASMRRLQPRRRHL